MTLSTLIPDVSVRDYIGYGIPQNDGLLAFEVLHASNDCVLFYFVGFAHFKMSLPSSLFLSLFFSHICYSFQRHESSYESKYRFS